MQLFHGFRLRIEEDQFNKKCRESKKQRTDLIESAKKLKSELAIPPCFSFSTRDDLYMDAEWHLQECISSLEELSTAIDKEFHGVNSKKRSAEYDLVWWLAIAFEKAYAKMYNIDPDFQNLVFAKRGNTECKPKNKACYHGDFFRLVSYVWWVLELDDNQAWSGTDDPDAIRCRYNLGRMIWRALKASTE